MKASRDREKQKGTPPRPRQAIIDPELAQQITEFCRQAHQENTKLLAQLQQRQQLLLARLPHRGKIQ